MARRYWFKAHSHGYGWHPHTWEAWIIFFVYIAVLVYSFIQIDSASHSVSDMLINFLPRVFIFSALLLSIAYLKGEPTTWRWGEKKK
jgi:uncharacterized protein YqhQ